MSRWLFIVGTATVSLLAEVGGAIQPGVARAAPVSSSWRQIRTADFAVVGNASEGELRRTAANIQAFRAAVATLFPESRLATPVPTSIIVFRDFAAFTRFQPRDSEGKRQQNVGGYATFGPDANMMVFGSPGRSESYPVVFHEYAHYLVHLNSREHLPLWLNEGLAEFYSTFDPDYKGRSLLGRPPVERMRALRGYPWMPLRNVVSPADMEKVWRSNRDIMMFYAEAWALVHYVMIERKSATPAPFAAYLKALASASSQDAAFVQAFGVNIDGMDRELQQYVRRLLFHALTLPASDAGQPPVAERLTEADVHHIQGRLLVRMDVVDEAEKELQAALDLEPTHAEARVTVASLRIAQDRPDEAIALLNEMTQAMPDHVPALYYLGTAFLDQWQGERAMSAFERATGLNPSHSYAWLGLSAAALLLNRDAQSRAALTHAVALEANPGHYYTHARTALRIGRNDVAAAAAHSYIDRVGLGETTAQYAAFLAAIAHWRAGQPAEAEAILAADEAAIAQGTWAFSVVQFLRGQIDADQLLAKAKSSGQKTEAHTYAGFKLDLTGRHPEALTHFQWVAEHGSRSYTEYALARNELARLQHVTAQR